MTIPRIRYIAMYKCSLCGKIFNGKCFDEGIAKATLTSLQARGLSPSAWNLYTGCDTYAYHDRDDHIALGELVGFEKEQKDEEVINITID